MKVVVGPVLVSVVETVPEVGRTGATGAATRSVDELDITVVALEEIEVEAAVETATEEPLLLPVDGGEAVTVGLMTTNAVDPASQPTPAQL